MSHVVKVEQRLQDPPQFFIVPADEAVAGLLPVVMGLLGRQLFAGLAAGLLCYFVWKHVKGERGIQGILALLYWITPKEMTIYRSFPDSAVSSWRA
ncbi:type IV conjugative transfer system protein TraL [Leisingera sp. ANG-Vp]|uniref:type IV conjugative transfer system protein TraL n=1 Tax=Leisingera sp. ANG-Vp TaxID=1577896 RepID=UPI00057D7BD1|nr:type IV conjugative transfer system protein TraL [Leisingera sp. ANG-Vp]KIC21334.1 hypothetical protein RA20_04850 [Leisingera sp. ANG-Vp]